MKKIFYILLFATISLVAKAQFTSDLVVYNSTGEPFKVSIEGSQVNDVFTNKVRVNDLESGYYILNIVFKNHNISNLSQKVFIPENTELACDLKKKYNGIYYAELFEVLTYIDNTENAENKPYERIKPLPPEPINDNQEGGVYCNLPMSDADFDVALQTVKNQTFDEEKLTTAKQIVASNCLLASQIKQISILFDFESSKLEFAKFAYTHTFDPNNYFIINDIFDFSSSIQKLNDYINSL